MGRKLKLSNFKCKECGVFLYQNGKELKGKYTFFMCLGRNSGCGESVWIDIVKKVDQFERKYE